MIKPQTVKHNHVVKSYNQPLILVTTTVNFNGCYYQYTKGLL